MKANRMHLIFAVGAILATGCTNDVPDNEKLVCESGWQVCGHSCCNGDCVDDVCKPATAQDGVECGDTRCLPGQKCQDGTCMGEATSLCASNQVVCQGACVSTATSHDHCGDCNTKCDEAEVCIGGKCTTQCPNDKKACGTSCVDVQLDAENCGECGHACTQGMYCANGECQCPAGKFDCDGNAANGCESSIRCDMICEDSSKVACGNGTCCNAKSECCGDSCCGEGTTCCGGNACVNVKSDAQNCGKCGHACKNGNACVDGACVLVCDDATPDICNDRCVDVKSDAQNCGECGAKCSPESVCQDNECVEVTVEDCENEGQMACWGKCIDTTSDMLNCGECGLACDETSEICIAGTCLPKPPEPTRCYGKEVDLLTDNNNCGECLNQCGVGELCTDGKCELQCGDLTRCNDACIDTTTSANHCGACGTVCKDGQVCSSSKCECAPGRHDCDGIAANGCESTKTCLCKPGATQPCWFSDTKYLKNQDINQGAIGSCKTGTQTCDASGQFWGLCEGAVYPSAITCDDKGLFFNNGNDDRDCDGIIDSNQTCMTACEYGLSEGSYIGCEYWAAYTENEDNRGYFSVILSNTGSSTATVVIYKYSNKNVFGTYTLAPGSIQAIYLTEDEDPGNDMLHGTVQKAAGFRIVSDQPITAYQFNPIRTSAIWNDALLLLPKNVYGKEYYNIIGSPYENTYMAIQATEPGMTTVTVTPSVETAEGGSFSAFPAGKPQTVNLNQYDVFQLTSLKGMTGTKASSTRPFVAIAGCKSCYNAVIMDDDTYDHYSEQLFPYQSWGKDFILAGYEKQKPKRTGLFVSKTPEHDQYRIFAAQKTTLTISPAISTENHGTIGGATQITVDAGTSYDIVTTSNFKLTASNPVLVASFIGDEASPYDPSYALVVPIQQYRSDYAFMVPPNYNENYLTIVAPTNMDKITIYKSDGKTVFKSITKTNLTSIGSTGYGFYRFDMGNTSAFYKMVCDKPISATSYGYRGQTSYDYPLGLNLKVLNDKVN